MRIYWPVGKEANDQCAEWISKHIWTDAGDRREIVNAQCCAVLGNDGEMLAAFAFYNWSPEAQVIEISAAAVGRWQCRRAYFEVYNYAFNTLKCQMVVQRNDPDDVKLNQVMLRYGFVPHLIPRLRGRDKDEIIFTLTDEDWRANGYHKENEVGHGTEKRQQLAETA